VSAIIGAAAYEPFVRAHRRPCVIAGFEPLDILYGVEGLLRQALAGVASVENQYRRVVRPAGNPRAQRLIADWLEPEDAVWRGLGVIPGSGLRLREGRGAIDAARRFGMAVRPGRPHPGCRCGDVLKGVLRPDACPLFGKACRPERPVGPCMVSAEGSCAAALRYRPPA
jgi:hydrogenase expression/formation protein HypD